jgi:hypothetical protein
MALCQFFSDYFGFSPVSVIPPMLHTQLHLHVALTRTSNARSPGNLLNNNVISEIREHQVAQKVLSLGLQRVMVLSTCKMWLNLPVEAGLRAGKQHSWAGRKAKES